MFIFQSATQPPLIVRYHTLEYEYPISKNPYSIQ